MAAKTIAGVACALVFAVGCTSEPNAPRTGDSSPDPAGTALRMGRYEALGDCDGLGTLRGSQDDVSFVAGGKVFVARRDGDTAGCVLEVDDAPDLEWGPEADRFHLGDLRRFGRRQISAPDDEVESISWSRPTGKSLVYVSDRRLMKVDAFGAEPFDISFLEDHDEVAYHPAGTHVAVTGTDAKGVYGLWLANNVGRDHQIIAIGEDARRIFSLSFAHDGVTLYYAAEHDDRYDLHSLELAASDETGETRNAELSTLDSDSDGVDHVLASEFAESQVAYTIGSCNGRTTTKVLENGRLTELGAELDGVSTQPAGWLPNGELLVLARPSGCDKEGTLYAWGPDETTELVAGVTTAGARAVLPPPPDPPSAEQQVVA